MIRRGLYLTGKTLILLLYLLALVGVYSRICLDRAAKGLVCPWQEAPHVGTHHTDLRCP